MPDGVFIAGTAGTVTQFRHDRRDRGGGTRRSRCRRQRNQRPQRLVGRADLREFRWRPDQGRLRYRRQFRHDRRHRSSDGVVLGAGGSVTNGQSGSSAGLISGWTSGVLIAGTAGTVTNFGTITGFRRHGVLLSAGGSVTNGQSGRPPRLIAGIRLWRVSSAAAAGTVTNFGSISGARPVVAPPAWTSLLAAA